VGSPIIWRRHRLARQLTSEAKRQAQSLSIDLSGGTREVDREVHVSANVGE